MQFGSQHLFPLERVETLMKGYYMDGKGEVYSTKRSGTPQRMHGSATTSGTYLTLNGRSFSKTQLQRQAMAHPYFKMETSVAPYVAATPAAPAAVTQRSHASTLADGIRARGWVIAKVAVVQGEEALLFGSKPAVHTTQASVDAELTRLATLNPGTKYVKLKIDGGLLLGGLTRL